MLLVICLLAFAAGTLLVFGLTLPTASRRRVEQRLMTIARPAMTAPPDLEAHLQRPFGERIARPALRRLARWAARLTPRVTAESVRARLIRAGHPAGLGVAEYQGLRVLSLMVFMLLGFATVSWLAQTPLLRAALVVFWLIIGGALPDSLLQQAIAERQRHIRKSLPETIDLLVISVEAGLGFDGALARVVEKTRGPLRDELERAEQEMRLGRMRGQALKEMAARLDIPELTTFVSAVYQADQLGVSIAGALRLQSRSLRVRRMQALREAAARLPIKMLFPLVFLIFPAIFVVVLGPALIRLFDAFSKM